MPTAYEHGYNARLAGCYRVLACPATPAEERDWLRGWDDADLMADPPTSPAPAALTQSAPSLPPPKR